MCFEAKTHGSLGSKQPSLLSALQKMSQNCRRSTKAFVDWTCWFRNICIVFFWEVTFFWRMRLTYVVSDETGEAFITFWDKQETQLMNKSLDQLKLTLEPGIWLHWSIVNLSESDTCWISTVSFSNGRKRDLQESPRNLTCKWVRSFCLGLDIVNTTRTTQDQSSILVNLLYVKI